MKLPFFKKKQPVVTVDADQDSDEFAEKEQDSPEVDSPDNGDQNQDELDIPDGKPSLENVKKDLNSKGGKNFSRMIKFLLLFVVIIVATFALTNKKETVQPTKQSDAAKPITQYQPNTSKDVVESAPYQNQVQDFNKENAAKAIDSAQSSQAIMLATGASSPVPVSADGKPQQPAMTQDQARANAQAISQFNSQQLQVQAQAVQTRQASLDAARSADFAALVGVLNSGIGASTMEVPIQSAASLAATATATAANAARAPAVVATTAIASSVPASSAVTTERILVETFQNAYATVDYAASTDSNNTVIASILSGQLKGSKISGSLQITENGEGKLTFSLLKIPGKQDIAINAQGVNLDTQRLLVDGTLDRKIWTRYGMPFIASMLGSYGQIMVTNGQQTVSVAGVGSVTNNATLTDLQIRQAAAGQAIGQIAGAIKADASAAKPAFGIAANQEIGVIFLANVVLKENK